ncbi:MAG: glutamate--tRNA ligase [Firmicutes bacterium ZCTH02-B6]|nr:MAG: glutamate--tRNA ligase [Firmicutes bacterium ZCTH02-B6]
MKEVRTRYAPSPTGYLHVGGARTALFNWLFARHHGGKFILRIEDTDVVRSTEESTRAIIEALKWLEIDWDEGPGVGGPYGPYVQSERLEIYRRYVEQLLAEGKAYRCYCTPEELKERRERLLAEGKAPMYDRHCLHLSEAERERLSKERPSVVRFLSPDEGEVRFVDHIRGEVVFENKVLDDLVILKSDGWPTYNFAVVVDDHLMRISHVIRGEDHLTNTARQIQLYQALGWEVPEFAHVPLILGTDRTRLSKRHGAVSVGYYREEGFLPEAMVNYLALLGWSYDDKTEIFSRQQLIEFFSLERVSKHGAIFDVKKLEWMNGVYIRETSLERLAELAHERLSAAGLVPKELDEGLRRKLVQIMEPLQTRIKTLGEIVPSTRFFFSDDLEFDEKAVQKFLHRDYVPGLFARLIARLLELDPWDGAGIEQLFKGLAEEYNAKLGDVIQPARVALTGTSVSPPIHDVIFILGRERTVERLRRGVDMASDALAAAPADKPAAEA